MASATPVIALCADANVEIGLHVTLRSLVENVSRPARIYIISDGFDSGFPHRIERTIAPYAKRVDLRFLPFSDRAFARFPPTVGSRYVYVRLMVPGMVDESKVLYLDSDLVVNLDVASLFDEPLHGHMIGASGLGTVEWQNEKEFLRTLGIAFDAPYFNAGVLLIDAERWRREGVTARCLEFAARHASNLKSADQTILNALFHKNFAPLAPECNILTQPDSRREETPLRPGIYHFLGQPKPWDFLGRTLHSNYEMFGSVLARTNFADFRPYRGFNLRKAVHVARPSRYYWRLIKLRLRRQATDG